MPPKLSNLSICYEAIQRVYRNAVLNFVRDKLRGSFPNDFEEKIRAPFKKEWPEIAASANERRETGEISNKLIDDCDILGVNHFFNLFEAYYSHFFHEGPILSIQAKTNR